MSVSECEDRSTNEEASAAAVRERQMITEQSPLLFQEFPYLITPPAPSHTDQQTEKKNTHTHTPTHTHIHRAAMHDFWARGQNYFNRPLTPIKVKMHLTAGLEYSTPCYI